MLKKLLAVAASVYLLSVSTISHAFGELENVTLNAFVHISGAPHAYIDQDLRKPAGLDVDIIYELQRRLLFSLKDNRIYPLAFNLAFERLKNGSADIVGGGISYSPARLESMDFSPVFYSSSLGIIYNTKNNHFKGLEDIKGKRIGVAPNSPSASYAKLYDATPVDVTNLTLALFDVAYGRLDGIIYDRPPIENFARTMTNLNLAVNVQEFGYQECQFAFALPKDSPYNKYISQAIHDMIEDGTMQRLLDKWGAK